MNFGSSEFGVTSPTTQTVTMWNSGTAPLNVSSVQSTQRDYQIGSNNCPATLGPGQTCTIAATFTPYAAGTRPAAIQVQHSGVNGAVSVSTAGSGVGGLMVANTSLSDIALAGGSAFGTGLGSAPYKEDDNRCPPPCSIVIVRSLLGSGSGGGGGTGGGAGSRTTNLDGTPTEPIEPLDPCAGGGR
ncbi:MAG: choice-of-anchor D domain-containing protein, partial [Rhodocyclaceae bacterium]|nr:choice-of-anchor D domain-containing protein [Rhodocyclaceae bacterium]